MRDKIFIDTNVFLYAFDHSDPAKKVTANTLIKEFLLSESGHISFQVVQEFSNVILKNTLMNPTDLSDYLEKVMFRFWRIMPSKRLYLRVIEIQTSFKFSYYDSLIIAAARKETAPNFTQKICRIDER